MKILLIFLSLLLHSTFISGANTLADPTKPASHKMLKGGDSASKASNKTLIVSAIMVSSHAKQAIINGKMFQEGQSVLGFQIVSIGNNQVKLTNSDGTKTLFVNNNNIKKDAQNGF